MIPKNPLLPPDSSGSGDLNEQKDYLKTGKSMQKDSSLPKLEIPSLTLPKGGGALKSIDEKFQVNAVNGTSSFSLPLPFSKTRNDFAPQASLSYNSGTGNSILGMGWGIDIPSIQRRTDKQIPQYRDSEDNDTYQLSGIEDLVPALYQDKSGNWLPDEFSSGTIHVKRYKPRVESAFSRIERIRTDGLASFYWKVTSRDNRVIFYGRDKESRISDPADPSKVLRWLPDLSYDDKGNCLEYTWLAEDLRNIAPALHEKNRLGTHAPFTNRYLKKISYGNRYPYFPDPDKPYNPSPPISPGYFFDAVADYGDHDKTNPGPVPSQDWDCRLDPFSDYRPGFELRTYRICQRILFYHTFQELSGEIPEPYLVRSFDFSYRNFKNTLASPAQIRNAEADQLIAVQEVCYQKNSSGTYDRDQLPAYEFTYQPMDWNTGVQDLREEDGLNAPAGLFGNYQWVDFYGEGISGILSENAQAWYYKSNLGNGTFSQAQVISPKPSLQGLNENMLQLADLEADGRKFIVSNKLNLPGYFELSDDNTWMPFKVFENFPNIDFSDPNLKYIDLNGDGRPDVLLSEDDVFTCYLNDGTLGYKAATKNPKENWDEELGPKVIFSDETQSIYTADMNGDGLSEIVRIRNGEIVYWPNLGFGRFGARVSMSLAPVFDSPGLFNPAYIRLGDINGTGATDIIYLGKNKFAAWLNQSGNSWTEAKEINAFPPTAIPATLALTDFLGTGTSCLVWSSPLTAAGNPQLRYIDLAGGKKPYILSAFTNNMGKTTHLEYKSSTWFFLQDKKAGTPWITKLPIPVQCLSNVRVENKLGDQYQVMSSSYSYHHGYYDHAEGEFRGFGRVEQTDAETFDQYQRSGTTNIVDTTLAQAPILTKTWYHTGFYERRKPALHQYANEYFQNQAVPEYQLPEPPFPTGLSTQETREAFRALKSMALRSETYALDKLPESVFPYLTTAHTYQVKQIQALTGNKNTVFSTIESESLTWHYDREPADPRIAHKLNLELDELGNILQTVSVVYPRTKTDPSAPKEVSDEQKKIYITHNRNFYTNDVKTDHSYRLRILSETQTAELTGLAPSSIACTQAELIAAIAAASPIAYETIADGSLQYRILEHIRVLFRSDDTTKALALGKLEALGLAYESYQLIFTPGLLTHIYGGLVTNSILQEGKYILSTDYKTQALFPESDPDGNWWIPTGHVNFNANAAQHFFMPDSYTDALGNSTAVNYYSDYFMLVESLTDAVGSSTRAQEFDFRLLLPRIMKDPNNNLSEVCFNILGFVAGLAIKGKGTEADDLNGFQSEFTQAQKDSFFQDPESLGATLLLQATSCFVYDFSTVPAKAGSISRETHYQNTLITKTDSLLRYSFDFTDGNGKLAMKKEQAEPGLAWTLDINNNLVQVDTNPRLRWIGTGRTMTNNKGNPVKQYESYFSTSPGFENASKLVQIGYSPTMYYDPTGRLIQTEFPDGTFTEEKYQAWKQQSFDRNDTVKDSLWYQLRTTGALASDPLENDAAKKSVIFHNTPASLYFDGLGRTIYTRADNVFRDKTNTLIEEFYNIRTVLDIEGNHMLTMDARGLTVMEHKFTIGGYPAYKKSMDSGESRILNDVMGNALYSWDNEGRMFQTAYDPIHRPLSHKVTFTDLSVHLYGKLEYGEGQPGDVANNLRGKLFRQYDGAGITEFAQYDFQGNNLKSTRTFTKDYTGTPDWSLAITMQHSSYTESAEFDALNRPARMECADGSIIRPIYGKHGTVSQVAVRVKGAAETYYVQDILYDEKGRRQRVKLGNNTSLNYEHDPLSMRLTRVLTNRNSDHAVLQDLNYTYDPVGNVTHIKDQAQQTVYFNNQQVEAATDFEYDSIYRLIRADGREHIGQNKPVDYNDAFRMYMLSPADGNQMQNYRQRYQYDAAGNMTRMTHDAGSGIFSNKWTRNLSVFADSNRLQKSDSAGLTETYLYDAYGNLRTGMSHLTEMHWNFKNQLEVIDLPNGDHAYYQYDASGQRARKVLTRGHVTEERVYNSSTEFFSRTGSPNDITRETLHIMDGISPVALVETRTSGVEDIPAVLIRYQFGNLLGSASLELDENEQIISYEEYYPYGSTSFQSGTILAEVKLKRYRYTGKERDEESGFYYHGARYYAPWLARWTASDPAGLQGGINQYAYAKLNPVALVDADGKQPTPPVNSIEDLLTFLHAQAGFIAGGIKPPTFVSSSASPFGTLAHAQATDVLAEMKAIFPGAERIYSEVRAIGGVITNIGGKPGGPKGAHNLDILVVKPGETAAIGKKVGDVGEKIVDLKYGGGVINPKYATHGVPLATETGRTASSATTVSTAIVEDSKAVSTLTKVDEAAAVVAKVEQAAGTLVKVEQTAATIAKVEQTAATVANIIKTEQAVVTVAKTTSILAKAAPIIAIVAKPLAVIGKVAGPLGIVAGVAQVVTAEKTEDKIDGGITAVSSALLMSKNPVAMAGGVGLATGQVLEKTLHVSDYSSAAGIKTYETLKDAGMNDTAAFVTGGVVTVLATPAAIGVAAVDKGYQGAKAAVKWVGSWF
jgi:RHS repeat-associated protein